VTDSLCPDCGCPVIHKMAGRPETSLAFSFLKGTEQYHDMTQCIWYLRDQLAAINLRLSRCITH